jgi:hypothetical protein
MEVLPSITIPRTYREERSNLCAHYIQVKPIFPLQHGGDRPPGTVL